MLLWGFFNEEGANFFKFEIVYNHNLLFSFSLPPYGVLAKKREIVNNDYAGVFLDLPFTRLYLFGIRSRRFLFLWGIQNLFDVLTLWLMLKVGDCTKIFMCMCSCIKNSWLVSQSYCSFLLSGCKSCNTSWKNYCEFNHIFE